MVKRRGVVQAGVEAALISAFVLLAVCRISIASPTAQHNTTQRQTPPRLAPMYAAAQLDALRAHVHRFLRLKAAEPLVHALPKLGVLFQIVLPAPRHLGRYCGRGRKDRGAVEVDMEVVDMLGKRAPRSLGSDGDGLFILETDDNRQLLPAEQAVLRRIPENEVWRVYYPSLARMGNSSNDVAEDVAIEVLTEVVTMKKVWANQMPREDCRMALAEELGYDPYTRDALYREEHPDAGIGLQAYTYPLPGEEDETVSSA
jgi:hypothetical protein